MRLVVNLSQRQRRKTKLDLNIDDFVSAYFASKFFDCLMDVCAKKKVSSNFLAIRWLKDRVSRGQFLKLP
jgi:hypothetical protein